MCLRPKGFGWILLSIVVISFPGILKAQQTTGNLQFSVQDSLGDPIPGINVAVSGPNLQGAQGVISDAFGRCLIPSLPPGRVSLRITHPAYVPTLIENVRIQLGKSTDAGKITLRQMIHDIPEIVISGVQADISANSTTYGSNIRPADFEDVPLGRHYADMVSMLPLSNMSYFGDGPNIGGATGFENKYFVDGIEVTDPLIQRDGTALPYNFIQEVEVKAGGYEADSRSALGGVLNVVTYSGTNELHGSAFGFYTSNRFTSNRRIGLFDPTQGGFSNYDVGISLGGPVVLDRLWFFVAYNPSFARRDVEVPGYGIFVDRTQVNSFAGKLTWRASERLKLVLTGTGDPTSHKAVARDVGAAPMALLSPDSYFQDIRYGGFNASLAGSFVVGENLLIDGSIARVNRRDTGDPATQRGREEPFFANHLPEGEAWSGGPWSRWDSFRYATMGRLAASLVAGSHSIKVGIDYKVNGTDNRYVNHLIHRFADTTFFERAERGYQTIHNRLYSLFLQDAWQISRNLSVHGGVRLDGQEIVASNGRLAQKVSLPLQPRVGFTYVFDKEGGHKVFGSFGRFSQEFALFNSGSFSDQGYSYVMRYRQDPRISRAGSDTIGGGPFSIAPGIDGLRGQHFDEFTLGYERMVAGTVHIRLEGILRTLREAIDNAYISSMDTWLLANPGRGLLSAWPRPQRDYAAIALTVGRTNAPDFNFLGSVVLSRDYGNYGGIFDAVTHSIFPNGNIAFDNLENTRKFGKGLLPNDRTWVVKLAGSYRFDFGLAAGLFFIAQTGTPLSQYAGTADFWSALVARRGTAGRTPSIWDLSARIAYTLPGEGFLRTRLTLDLFHIGSQRSAVDIQQWRGYLDANGQFDYVDPNYGKAYRYQPPMSARLGMEITY